MKVHGTSVSIDGDGVLFRGPPGSGKSDLALRMINFGAQLVSDDQVCLTRRNDNIFMSSPQIIRNSMEVRGIGIVNSIAQKEAPLILVLNMLPNNVANRMPIWHLCTFLDIKVPAVEFAPFEISAHLKVKLAVNLARKNGIEMNRYE
jgi:Serine kinase of the HPr protein, regulates carbohydrate metabolism